MKFFRELIIVIMIQSTLTRYCEIYLPLVTSLDPIIISLDENFNSETLGIKGATNGKSLEIHEDQIKFIGNEDTLTYPLSEIHQFKYPVYQVVFGKYNSVLPVGPNTFAIVFRFEGDFQECKFEEKINSFYQKLTEEVHRRISVSALNFLEWKMFKINIALFKTNLES